MAIKTQAQILADSSATYFDNVSGSITPATVRSLNTDWIDSTMFLDNTGSYTVGAALTASSTPNAIVTASALDSTITFTKGNGSTFQIVIAQSGSIASASYATFAASAATASYVLNAVSASSVVSASYSLSGSFAVSASYAATSSKVALVSDNGNNNHKVLFASATNDIPDGEILFDPNDFTYNPSQNLASVTASVAISSSVAVNANSASYVLNAVSASAAVRAVTASYSLNSELLDNLDSTSFVTTSSFTPFSSSVSASLATKATLNANNTFTGNNVFGNITASNAYVVSASIEFLSVIYQTSSVVYSSGSNQFGDAANDVQTLYGTVNIVTGPVNVSGSLNANGGVVGNLTGTSSWSSNAISASRATSAFNADTASFVTTAQTASFVLNAVSSSYALSSSFATDAATASFVLNAISSSFALTASSVNNLNQNLNITGGLTVITGSVIEFEVTNIGVRIGNASTDSHNVTGSLNLSGSFNVSGSVSLTGSVGGNVVSASISSATSSLDFSLSNFFTSLVSGSTNFNITNPRRGQTVNVLLTTVGVASASFSSNVRQVSGSRYTPTSGSANDVLTFVSWDGSSVYLANVKNLI